MTNPEVMVLFFTDDGRMEERGPFESVRFEVKPHIPSNVLVVPPVGDTLARFVKGKWHVTGAKRPFAGFEIYVRQ